MMTHSPIVYMNISIYTTVVEYIRYLLSYVVYTSKYTHTYNYILAHKSLSICENILPSLLSNRIANLPSGDSRDIQAAKQI